MRHEIAGQHATDKATGTDLRLGCQTVHGARASVDSPKCPIARAHLNRGFTKTSLLTPMQPDSTRSKAHPSVQSKHNPHPTLILQTFVMFLCSPAFGIGEFAFHAANYVCYCPRSFVRTAFSFSASCFLKEVITVAYSDREATFVYCFRSFLISNNSMPAEAFSLYCINA